MKLKTSLISGHRDVVRIVVPTVTVVAAAMAIATIALAIDLFALRSESSEFSARIAALRANTQGSTEPARQAMQNLSAVRARIGEINALVGTRGTPTPTLLSTFETLLPDRAYFISFHQRAESGEVLVTVAATDAAPLTAFLRALEREPRFQQVLLLHQSPLKQAGGMQFQIRIKERA